MKPTLAVMAIFRNEAHILAEWCQHYAAQGASKIFLLNHRSTDHYQAVLDPFITSGLVALIDVHGDHPQIKAYNALRPRIRRAARWLLVCDLDEFVYARRGHTLSSYLRTLPWLVSEVLIPWKNFGSSNHHQHPEGLVSQNFLYRWSYTTKPQNTNDQPADWCKYIVRSRRIRFLTVHHASVWFGRIIAANGERIRRFNGRLKISEEFLAASALHLNHYAIQSREFFETIKMKRPDVNAPEKDAIKNWRYFQDFDRNEIYDPELALLWNPNSERDAAAGHSHAAPADPQP